MLVISWDFPENTGLKYWIDKTGLHPVTSLISLTKAQKQWLLQKEIVLCNELATNQNLFKEMGIPEKQKKKILREAERLIQE